MSLIPDFGGQLPSQFKGKTYKDIENIDIKSERFTTIIYWLYLHKGTKCATVLKYGLI